MSSVLRHLQLKHVKRLLRGKKQPSAGEKIAAGDRARNERDWSTAAAAYREALKISPALAPIWVQLGHALKESGDIRAALEAYQQAIELEPRNSDTALQLGHAWKLANDRELARTWYEKALQLPPGEMAAVAELAALGVKSERIEELIEPNQREDQTLGSGPLLWDISEFMALRAAGETMPVDLLWSTAVAAAMTKLGLAVPAFAHPETLEWRSLPTHQVGDNWPYTATGAASEPPQALPPDFSALVITPSPNRGVDDVQWRAVASVQKMRHVPLITFLPSVALWESEEGARGANKTLTALNQALAASSLVIVPRPFDRELVEGRLRRLGRGSLATLALPEVTRAHGTAPTRSNLVRDVVLCPPDPRELEAISAAHRAMSDGAKLSVLTGRGVVADGANRKGDGLDAHFDGLEGARSLIIPSGCNAAAVWAAVAREHGLKVIASRHDALLRGHDGVDEYIDFCTPELAANIWRDLLARGERSSGTEAERWSEAMRRALDDLRTGGRTLPASDGFTIRFGHFYGLVSGGSGLRLRSGPGWRAPLPHGSQIDSAGAALLIRLNNLHNRPCKIAFLMCAPHSHGTELEVRFSTAPEQVERRSIPDPWGWVTVEFPKSQGESRSAVEISLGVAGGNSDREDGQPAVAGFMAYPSAQDSLWHQFLDRASRGLVPELVAVRSWADRLQKHGEARS